MRQERQFEVVVLYYYAYSQGKKIHYPILEFIPKAQMTSDMWFSRREEFTTKNFNVFMVGPRFVLKYSVIGSYCPSFRFCFKKLFDQQEYRAGILSSLIINLMHFSSRRLSHSARKWLDPDLDCDRCSTSANVERLYRFRVIYEGHIKKCKDAYAACKIYQYRFEVIKYTNNFVRVIYSQTILLKKAIFLFIVIHTNKVFRIKKLNIESWVIENGTDSISKMLLHIIQRSWGIEYWQNVAERSPPLYKSINY